MVEEITDATFEQESNSGLVLIDFWAPWCGPCRMQGPILDVVAEAVDETQLRIFKLNVDDNPEVTQHFQVMSIPTLLMKKDGEVVERLTGVHTKEQLLQLVEKHS